MNAPTLTALKAELQQLMSSWAYAFAMAHGCSIAPTPESRALIERVADLRSQIEEHQ
jgi:hypothetical protein